MKKYKKQSDFQKEKSGFLSKKDKKKSSRKKIKKKQLMAEIKRENLSTGEQNPQMEKPVENRGSANSRKQTEYGKADEKITAQNGGQNSYFQDGKQFLTEEVSSKKSAKKARTKQFSVFGKMAEKSKKVSDGFTKDSFLENVVEKSEEKLKKKEIKKKYRSKKDFQKSGGNFQIDKEKNPKADGKNQGKLKREKGKNSNADGNFQRKKGNSHKSAGTSGHKEKPSFKNATEVAETSVNKVMDVGKQVASAASVPTSGGGDDKDSNAAYSAAAAGVGVAYTVAKHRIKRVKKKFKKMREKKPDGKESGKSGSGTFKREDNFGTEETRESKKGKKRRRQEEKNQKGGFKKESTFEKEKNPEKDKKTSEKKQKKENQRKHQKKKTQRENAKKIRKSKSGASVKDVTAKASDALSAAAKKLTEAVGKYAGILVIIGVIMMVLMLLSTTLASCGSMFSDGIGTVVSYSYQSNPSDIGAAELSMTAKEAFMNMRVYNIETDFPDYDEYVYFIGDTGHDAFHLISYLSAVHTTFTASGVEAELEQIFNEMCVLETVPSEETRTRTVVKVETRLVLDPETGEPVTDPETGEAITELYTYLDTEEYKVSILTVTLSVTPLEAVIYGKMTAEQRATYEVLNDTHGLIQTYWSPLAFDWHGSVISGYGYSFDKDEGEMVFNHGLDIAVSYGADVYAAMDGVVKTVSYAPLYGNYIVLENADGHCTKYGYLGSTSVSEGQTVTHGQVIGKTGSEGLRLECLYHANYYNPFFYFE